MFTVWQVLLLAACLDKRKETEGMLQEGNRSKD
jgi:hypothetical protein